MSRQSRIVNMSLPSELYSQMEQSAKRRGISRSQILKESLQVYLDEETRWRQIRQWGSRTARKFRLANEDDVERIREETSCSR